MIKVIHTTSLIVAMTLVVATSAWAQSPSQPQPAHPTVDATGTIKSVDRQAGTITFEDGRTVKATGQTMIWQPTKIDALQPGAQVFVRNAQPALAQGTSGETRMGTVLRVDPANALVLLSDGTLVRVSPSTKMQMQDKRLTISELQPGDEIVFRPKSVSTTSPSAAVQSGQQGTAARTSDAPSAMAKPQAVFGSPIDADEVRVMRRPQAP